MSPSFAIGIDIGGTSTKIGIVDHSGKVICQDTLVTNTFSSVDLFIDSLYNKIVPMIQQVGGIDTIIGIGVGAPNGNIYSGAIEYAPNLQWKGIIPLASFIQIKFGLPTTLTNDANAAALGEMMYGATKNVPHFIMITLGTGVGSGIVIDGKIVVGHDGFAGELGHTIIRHDGRLHIGTGMRGSVESYASATGVINTALEFLNIQPEKASLLRNYAPESLTSKDIYTCAMQGDDIAKEVFEFTGKILGEALSNFVMFSSPEVIVLFGGLTNAGALIMTPTKFHLEKNLLPIFKNKIKLVFSELNESDAAIIGASALAWEK